MSKYRFKTTIEFDEDHKNIRRNFELKKRLQNKMNEILENPYHYKPLRNVLKNKRRTHIGSFVLIFEVTENDHSVTFHSFKHHDESYE